MGTARTRVVILALAAVLLAAILLTLKYRSNTRAIETNQPSPIPTFSPTGGTIVTSPAEETSPPAAPSPEPALAASPFASLEETREASTPTPDNSFVGRLNLIVPVAGVRPDQLIDTFNDARSEGRVHDAIDIPAPAGTPVLAAADGEIIKLFPSERGGTTIYQLSMDKKLVFYYAHLQRYADGLAVETTCTREMLLPTLATREMPVLVITIFTFPLRSLPTPSVIGKVRILTPIRCCDKSVPLSFRMLTNFLFKAFAKHSNTSLNCYTKGDVRLQMWEHLLLEKTGSLISDGSELFNGNGEGIRKMKQFWHSFEFGLLAILALIPIGCATQPAGNSNSVTTVASPSVSPLPSPSPKTETKTVAVTLPVLDALFANEDFKGELKSKLQLSDAQINSLRTIAGDEVGQTPTRQRRARRWKRR